MLVEERARCDTEVARLPSNCSAGRTASRRRRSRASTGTTSPRCRTCGSLTTASMRVDRRERHVVRRPSVSAQSASGRLRETRVELLAQRLVVLDARKPRRESARSASKLVGASIACSEPLPELLERGQVDRKQPRRPRCAGCRPARGAGGRSTSAPRRARSTPRRARRRNAPSPRASSTSTSRPWPVVARSSSAPRMPYAA